MSEGKKTEGCNGVRNPVLPPGGAVDPVISLREGTSSAQFSPTQDCTRKNLR